MPSPLAWTGPVTPASAARAREYLQRAREAALAGPEWPAPEADPLPAPGTLAVVGAGTMGTGIAQCALAAGLAVHLIDAREDAARRGAAQICASLERAQASGRLAAADVRARLERLRAGTDDGLLATADVAIEAVYEDLALKQALFARLGRACPGHALLLSNTSTLDIDAIAGGSGAAARAAGMHFLTPAHVTPLVEIVRGDATSDASLAQAHALARRLGKLPVLAGKAWGFIGNRMFEGYLREVDALQLEGVPAERIDRALERFGFALGPCRTLDMAGTDLVSQVLETRGRYVAQGPAYRRITRRLAELGRFGHKSGRGHYLYEGRAARPDPDLARVCAEEARRLGIAPRPDVDDGAIVARCLQPLVDEGRQLLAEGMARRAGDIDLVWVLGYGFPADRGGPMAMAGIA